MFARVLALLPLAFLVSASHLEARDQCHTGGIYCCNSVQSVEQESQMLHQLGIAAIAAEIGGLVGMQCSSVAVIGGGNGCDAEQQPVCCKDNQFNGLVNLGCSVVNVRA